MEERWWERVWYRGKEELYKFRATFLTNFDHAESKFDDDDDDDHIHCYAGDDYNSDDYNDDDYDCDEIDDTYGKVKIIVLS